MPSATSIMQTISRCRSVPLSVLRSNARAYRFSHPRQEICWAIRSRTDLSLPDIGRLIGGRDHTTVMHAIRAVERRMRVSEKYRSEMEGLLRIIDSAAPIEGEAEKDDLIARARRVIDLPETITTVDAICLAAGMLSLLAVLTSDGLNDREARVALRQIALGTGGISHV